MTQQTRRSFLKTSVAAGAAGTMPYWFTSAQPEAFGYQSASERPVVGCIGTGSRWGSVGPASFNFADCAAVCDVDANHAGAAKERVAGIQKKSGRDRQIDVYEDYRKILERDDIDIVTIVTPDHWHSKIAIEAMQAGKDVYCEKPLTLTINEGKQIIKVLNETKRVFQVGTQQRTDFNRRFLHAIAMIRDGRVGDVRKITCNIGPSTDSGGIPVADIPSGLNWDMWLGQCPVVEYRSKADGSSNKRFPASRCHYEFRWWYEYSGGKMTDWGAHHVDIAQWAIEQNGPVCRSRMTATTRQRSSTSNACSPTASRCTLSATRPTATASCLKERRAASTSVEAEPRAVRSSNSRTTHCRKTPSRRSTAAKSQPVTCRTSWTASRAEKRRSVTSGRTIVP
jgi:predicted dehydrogenase